MRAVYCFVLSLLMPDASTLAQPSQASLRIEVRADDAAVVDAEITVNGARYRTDVTGTVVAVVPPGPAQIVVIREGFSPATTAVDVSAGEQKHVIVELAASVEVEETITVSATRTDKRLEDQPLRVEVLVREEIEEKMLMTPGDIVMMLNEMGGLRVQATSPSLGAASVRIQGMRGRYTRFLSDGLPLFGEVGGLGLLQIPPMDLGQVEVIKGVASSLYGAGAMGGVVNLISRQPGAQAESELLVNRSAKGASDVVFFSGIPLRRGWALTTLASGHWHEEKDIDDDAWADLPSYSRGVFRPRLFWDGAAGSRFFATAGVTVEERTGGTVEGGFLPQTQAAYVEALTTKRWDVGFLAQTLWRGAYVVTARGAVSQQHHRHTFGEFMERDRHGTMFGEVALRGSRGPHTWVLGAAVERDAYRPTEVPQFTYSFTTPGVFAQDDVEVRPWLSVSVSARADHHSEYGFFLSPRVAALVRSGQWNSRLSIGTGFFGPSVLTEETEASGLSRVTVPHPLRAEQGRSASFDLTRVVGPTSHTVTVFGSRIVHPVDVDRRGAVVFNAEGPTTTAGVELLSTFRHAPFAVTASYAYVRAREDDAGRRVEAALTPAHSAGIVGMWEREDVGRIGAEWYYTGAQRLEDNPFRTRSEPYMIVGVLAERQLGRVRLFVNGENLTGVRQTQWNSLLRPGRGSDGRWTVDAWAPLEGRNVNGGIRLRF
jgi:outer membrane receptor for ferrienterochelin and colicins